MFNPADYHPKWSLIRRLILRRAGHACEWCGARDRHQHPRTGSMVYLAVAHIDRDRRHNRFWNLAALCQKCHLTHDRQFHIVNTRGGRAWRKDQFWLALPDGELLEAFRAGRVMLVPVAKVRARLIAKAVRVWPRPQLMVPYAAPTLFDLPPALTAAQLKQRRPQLISAMNVTAGYIEVIEQLEQKEYLDILERRSVGL